MTQKEQADIRPTFFLKKRRMFAIDGWLNVSAFFKVTVKRLIDENCGFKGFKIFKRLTHFIKY